MLPLTAAAAMMLWAALPAAADPRTASSASNGSACTLAAGHLRTATGVTASDTIALDDGSEVKLAGLIGARAGDAAVAVADWPPEAAAQRALADMVIGKTVSIHPVTARPDRYRRLVAQVVVEADGERRWVQARLLADGHARAYALGDAFACAEDLLAYEREARERKAGIWAIAAYSERAAYRTRELLRLRGTFQVVSGRVRKVSEMKSAIFLNFGTDWHTDFTTAIRTGKGALGDAAFTATVRALEGRRVRVRGWVDRRNGPYIELGHAAELEVLDDGAPRGGTAPSTVAGSNEKRPEP